MTHWAQRFLCDESASVTIEYAMIALLVSTAIVTLLIQVKTSLLTMFAGVNAGFAK